MTERVTRSRTGKTPSKPFNPGFVETPGRKKYTRKSTFTGLSDAENSTPEPFTSLTEPVESGSAANGGSKQNGGTYTNGFANGFVNGHANGHTNGSATKAPREELKKIENPAIDTSGRFEFGGSFGVSALMILFPSIMYFMWIGAIFYDGKIPWPTADQSFKEFLLHMVSLIKTEAYPSNRAWSIYWYFGLVQMAFYMLLPGVYRKGKPLAHLNGQQLDYYCSGMWSFYTSIVLGLVLHFTGVFKLYTLVEEFGPIMSVAIISGFLCSFIAYFSAWVRGARIRMSGYPVYDFFMGSELNPRLFGILDFKMFLEVRIPWFMMFFLSLGAATKQYEEYGYVSGEVCFILLAHYLYAGACAKGEHLIITTWDMYYEKLGFMLVFWNMAGVPLSYCHCTLYLATHHPDEYHWPTWFIALLIMAYLAVYYVWDTCNSQKNQFRQEERGVVEERTTFPYFKYGRIKDPKTITTKHGNKILCDGWYGKARKVHYPCDLFFALCWGLITGFKSPFPWFYPAFFSVMIVHRAMRDIERCRERYGEAWMEYERRVPYLFIPYVF
ncbi:uncharacterized protein BDR25DRAFT_252516 [Lindgomyces ingoldianus]|uniref:Uncharacterized protein n=1 Tax=Lindgomyces ingoldianus TaxID=673940 RepID=A0ACB6RB68_9PLEO|nr:uncharacterized protein BDR25DRAFT_252516 [Lindgomyces ingoldianus]KAF2476484.1 hypothetical protein BDR25DRAFT_252516 [Lindgomyces ingoldianus]